MYEHITTVFSVGCYVGLALIVIGSVAEIGPLVQDGMVLIYCTAFVSVVATGYVIIAEQ